LDVVDVLTHLKNPLLPSVVAVFVDTEVVLFGLCFLQQQPKTQMSDMNTEWKYGRNSIIRTLSFVLHLFAAQA